MENNKDWMKRGYCWEPEKAKSRRRRSIRDSLNELVKEINSDEDADYDVFGRSRRNL